MAMTKAELAKQLEALQAQYDDMEDDDDEMWVRLPNGNEVCLKGARLKTYLKKNGLSFDEPEVEEVVEVAPKKTTAPRKTAAKKTAAKPVKPAEDFEEGIDDLNDIIEEEAEETAPRRFF